MDDSPLEMRAARHAALGDAMRLAIVDELMLPDRAPVELRQLLGIESNLLAHHLERDAAGHRTEEPSERPAALCERDGVADEGQRDRHDASKRRGSLP